jgi:hypothetical protein
MATATTKVRPGSRPSRERREGSPAPAPPERLAASSSHPARTYTCPCCDHVLRVFGIGRHRVYLELEADPSDPVMNRACPACGEPLPGKSAAHPSEKA